MFPLSLIFSPTQEHEQQRQASIWQKWQKKFEAGDAHADMAAFPERTSLRDAVMRLPCCACRHPAAVVDVESRSLRDALADEREEATVFFKFFCVVVRAALDACEHLARVTAVEAVLQEDIGQERNAAMKRCPDGEPLVVVDHLRKRQRRFCNIRAHEHGTAERPVRTKQELFLIHDVLEHRRLLGIEMLTEGLSIVPHQPGIAVTTGAGGMRIEVGCHAREFLRVPEIILVAIGDVGAARRFRQRCKCRGHTVRLVITEHADGKRLRVCSKPSSRVEILRAVVPTEELDGSGIFLYDVLRGNGSHLFGKPTLVRPPDGECDGDFF